MAKAVEVFKTNAIEVGRLKAERIESEDRAAQRRKLDMQRLAAVFEGAVGDIIQNVSLAAARMETSANSLAITAEKTAQLSTVVASASGGARTKVQFAPSGSAD